MVVLFELLSMILLLLLDVVELNIPTSYFLAIAVVELIVMD